MKPKLTRRQVRNVMIILAAMMLLLAYASLMYSSTPLMIGAFVFAFAALTFHVIFNRCPQCGKYLGRGYSGTSCPFCGRHFDD